MQRKYIYNAHEFEIVNSVTYNYKLVTTHPQVMLYKLVPFDPPFKLTTHYVAITPEEGRRVKKLILQKSLLISY